MQPFSYARPTSVAEATTLLQAAAPEARALAGGTDLIIRLRDATLRPRLVVDVKRIVELAPDIDVVDGGLRIGATATMSRIAADPRIRSWYPALAEAAAIVGPVQVRNRATLAGNICNASPAADTAPPLLVYRATVRVVGPRGERLIPLDAFFVSSGVTALRPDELVTAIELPAPVAGSGAAYLRRTRRRGHDLASVTLCCGVDPSGVTRLAYGSVGPRPVLASDEAGVLADPTAPSEERAAAFDGLFAEARPSPRSMRAGPAYRLAMLRVLGFRALDLALSRRAAAGGGAP
jgi:carbon-monoxide dehydrogenase medium subunit